MDRKLSVKIKGYDGQGRVEGYVSVYGNKDLNGDIVEPGAFSKTIQETGGEVVMLAHHDRTRPIGIARVDDRPKGLFLTGQIEVDLPDGELAHRQASKGLLRGLSIGDRTVKESWDEAQKAFRLHKIKLFEASLVAIPANPLTLIESVKGEYELLARATEEIKAGRTLSAATRKRLEAAIEEIQALLSEADASAEEAAAGDGKHAATADEPLLHSLRGLAHILRPA